MAGEAWEAQTAKLAEALDHSLKLVDQELAYLEVPLPKRPFKATVKLLQHGLVEVGGAGAIDLANPSTYFAEPWFRALYVGVERWYHQSYAESALEPAGNAPLIGVVEIKDSPFLIEVPMHRSKIEVEGKTTWIYFEAGVGEGENPRDWLIGGPNLSRLTPDEAQAADAELHSVATSLRTIKHHLDGVGQSDIEVGLRASVRSYLESAARLVRAQEGRSYAFAWMDLQMAAESAIKLALTNHSGTHPHGHDLARLLVAAADLDIEFNPARLASWPSFKTMSDRRYGRGSDLVLWEMFEAYRLSLDFVTACVRTIKPALPAGAGLCIHIAPWLVDDPLLPRRGTSAQPIETAVED